MRKAAEFYNAWKAYWETRNGYADDSTEESVRLLKEEGNVLSLLLESRQMNTCHAEELAAKANEKIIGIGDYNEDAIIAVKNEMLQYAGDFHLSQRISGKPPATNLYKDGMLAVFSGMPTV